MSWQNTPRLPFDVGSLVRRSVQPACFVCEYLAGNPDYEHVELMRNEHAVAFLDRYPTVFGRIIVAPTQHREQVTGDFEKDEYLELQRAIYDVTEAMRKVLQPERVYVLSLGSQAANAHVHWHLVPVPPGLPLKEQQFHLLMHEHGAIEPDAQAFEDYAAAIREALPVLS